MAQYLITTAKKATKQLKILLSNGMPYQVAYKKVLENTDPLQRREFSMTAYKYDSCKTNAQARQRELSSLPKSLRKHVIAMHSDSGFYSNTADA